VTNKTKQKQQDPETKFLPFLLGNKLKSQKVENKLKGTKIKVKKQQKQQHQQKQKLL
jgi:hypothetical protein